jgi:hypothetical protein
MASLLQLPDVVLQKPVFHTFSFGPSGGRNGQICYSDLVHVEDAHAVSHQSDNAGDGCPENN